MKKKGESRLWRWLTNLWTIFFFAIIFEDYRTLGSYTHLLGPIAAIYIGLLAIYSTEKEFERWKFYFVGRHPGEIYVVAWTILILGLLLTTYITGSSYKMEPEVFSSYVAVLGILAVTRKSRSIFIEYRKNH